MKEFMLIFRLSREGTVKPSAEQVQARKNWFGSVVSDQKLADKGNTLSPISAKVIGADMAVADGPYVSSGHFVSGYMVVKSNSIDDAVELAKTNPIFSVGGLVEVREVVAFITGD